MANIGSKSPTRIGVLPLPGFALMSYACVVEPFRAANLLSRKSLYELVNFSLDGPVPSSGAVTAAQEAQVGDTPPLDYLFVVAGGDPVAFEDRGCFAWLARMDRRGVTLGGGNGCRHDSSSGPNRTLMTFTPLPANSPRRDWLNDSAAAWLADVVP